MAGVVVWECELRGDAPAAAGQGHDLSRRQEGHNSVHQLIAQNMEQPQGLGPPVRNPAGTVPCLPVPILRSGLALLKQDLPSQSTALRLSPQRALAHSGSRRGGARGLCSGIDVHCGGWCVDGLSSRRGSD